MKRSFLEWPDEVPQEPAIHARPSVLPEAADTMAPTIAGAIAAMQRCLAVGRIEWRQRFRLRRLNDAAGVLPRVGS